MNGHEAALLAGAGLCASCRHARVVLSDRGSAFLLCRLSRKDPRFARYPGLPVWGCPGHEPGRPGVDQVPGSASNDGEEGE